jgi:hypothetical protein
VDVVTLAIAVVAHQRRAAAAQRLAEQVGATITWDRGKGEQDTHQRALVSLLDTDARHLLLLEDDALPAPDFHTRVHTDLALLPPRHLASGYLGTGRGAGVPPARWDPMVTHLLAQAEGARHHWVVAPAMWHAVAMLIPRTVATDLHGWLRARPRAPTDQAVTTWVRAHGWHVAYPVASSWVDHDDGPTVTQHPDHQPRTQPRRAWRMVRAEQHHEQQLQA